MNDSSSDVLPDVLIVGGGIGGLVLALSLHQAGISCRVIEAAAQVLPLGVGINLLPHAMRELSELGLADKLAARAIETRELRYYSRHGQFIHKEPRGRFAGYDWAQLSIHRADLHEVLFEAVRGRLGEDAIQLGHRCLRVAQDAGGVLLHCDNGATHRGRLAVGADGIHSVVRRQLYPDEGPPRYSGVNMWRGVTRWKPVLTGASMIRAGWLATGKLVFYPIRNAIDAEGRQLVNWVWEIETPEHSRWDWNRRASVDDFIADAADWHFDWLDVPALFRAAEQVLEYPMVDKDPLPAWTFGRVTLLGDAAHPMYPRGSNGAGQAILDARSLASFLSKENSVEAALKAYEAERLGPTSNVVLTNRREPPDVILREVYERTGDRPFERIEDVISASELAAITERYRKVAGYTQRELKENRP